jgi:hypothetical protein
MELTRATTVRACSLGRRCKSASNLESFEILDRICPFLGLCSCSSVHNAQICTVEYGKVFREYRELHPDIYLHLNLLSALEILKM